MDWLNSTSAVVLAYDGSFEGFLTCIFHVYDRKLKQVEIRKEILSSPGLFETKVSVISDSNHAERVWKGLRKRVSADVLRQIYMAYLSELPDMEKVLLGYISHVFTYGKAIKGDYANPFVLRLSKIVKMVGRESHKMEAFVRFRLTRDNIYFATIEPDFDVLPLVTRHFKNRYADQRWLIYDLKRNYGVYYDLNKTETIQLSLDKDFKASQSSPLYFDESEDAFQDLWKNYFNSTNIASRKNMKLHIRHVPKRYWKYLSEKQPS